MEVETCCRLLFKEETKALTVHQITQHQKVLTEVRNLFWGEVSAARKIRITEKSNVQQFIAGAR